LLAYYPLDETTGSMAEDVSGNKKHGHRTHVLTASPVKVMGASAEFDGKYSCIETGVGAGAAYSKLSAAFWFRSTSSGGGWSLVTSSAGRIFSSEIGALGGIEGHFNFGGTGSSKSSGPGALTVDVVGASGYITSTKYDDAKWHMAALVFDVNSATFKVYIDGSATPVYSKTTTQSLSLQPKYNFLLGCRYKTSRDEFTKLHMDEVGIWNRLLTVKEIAWLYNSGKGRRPVSVGCGDGVKNGTEECDGSDLGSATCISKSFPAGGTLKCNDKCKLDTTYCTTKDTYGTWAKIPAGKFMMGSPGDESCRETDEDRHVVTLTTPFEIQTTEVTQTQYTSLLSTNPSKFSTCSTCPVEQLTWHQAAAYANALSDKNNFTNCYKCTGSGSSTSCTVATSYAGASIYSCPGYRLPTDAEWEYAYRAGTSTSLYNGQLANCSGQDTNADKISWYDKNSNSKTLPVKQKATNNWGLYDMAGNVHEMCHDFYAQSLGTSPITDPAGPSSNPNSYHVHRGGGYNFASKFLRAAFRGGFGASHTNLIFGFRVVRSLPPKTKWVTVKAGSFQMGSPSGEKCRESGGPKETPHKVTLTHDFSIAATETTQAQFNSLMNRNPSGFSSCGPSCPVETVNWHEAAAYCNALSKKESKTACYTCSGSGASITCTDASAYSSAKIYKCPGYRLPTEAEWEYAYRAGTTTAFYNGSIKNCTSPDANASKIAWHNGNAGSKTHPAAGMMTNAWGLYDMAGNVWEWTHDWYQISLGTTAVIDPIGAGTTYRVTRGGTWQDPPKHLRAATRNTNSPSIRNNLVGFRCVRTLNP